MYPPPSFKKRTDAHVSSNNVNYNFILFYFYCKIKYLKIILDFLEQSEDTYSLDR